MSISKFFSDITPREDTGEELSSTLTKNMKRKYALSSCILYNDIVILHACLPF